MKPAAFPWLAAAVVFLVHAVGNAHYGFFRDELYFIICGRHPQWGYVDQPPIVPLLAAATQTMGHSLFLLRIVPALFAAAGAYVTCLLVLEFGGGLFAQVLATLTFLFSGVLMSFGQKVSPDEVGLFTWPLLALLLVRLAKGGAPRLWLTFGIVAGLSIQSKYSVLFFLAAVLAGVLLVPQRRILRTPWCAAGVAAAVSIALPNFLWQAHYGFPMLQLLAAGQHGKNLIASPVLYVVQEILITNLFLFAVWAIGLVWLARMERYRFLAIAYVVLIGEMLLFHGKHYYPADVYPILIAAGAAQIERWTARLPYVRGAAIAYALVLGPAFVPFALPILPERSFLGYQDRLQTILHVKKETLATEHGRETSALPGDWADMHGWPELAASVDRIYSGLPADERRRAVVIASNYGEASAIEFFAPHVPVASGHNQFWLWGPPSRSADILIDVNGDCGAPQHVFKNAVLAERFSAPYAIGWEQDIPIMICRGVRQSLAERWPAMKRYY